MADPTPADRAKLDQFAATAHDAAKRLTDQAKVALAEGVDVDVAAYSLAVIVRDALARGEVTPDQTAMELAWLVVQSAATEMEVDRAA